MSRPILIQESTIKPQILTDS